VAFSGYASSIAEENASVALCLVKQCECYHSDPKTDSESSLRIKCVQISVPLDEKFEVSMPPRSNVDSFFRDNLVEKIQS